MTNCLFFGDSITFGEFDGVYGGWVDLLKRYAFAKYNEGANEVTIFNLGIGGETTEGLLKRFDIEFEARKSPTQNVIFIAYGANDLAIKESEVVVAPDKYNENLSNVISNAKKAADAIFLVNILPIAEELDGTISATGKLRTNKQVVLYNEIVANVAKQQKVNHIDLHTVFLDVKEVFLSKDGIHPNEKGYKFIFEQIKPIIENYF